MTEPKRAPITGITGQDSGHMTELLHEKGYEIFGLIRGHRNARRESLVAEFPYVNLIEADLTDQTSMTNAVLTSEPDEIYNLGAISHVGYSFRNPQLTCDITAKGVLNLLETVRVTHMHERTRIYQASTSEMFGGLDYTVPGPVTARTRCSTRAAPTAWPSSTPTGSPRTTASPTACSSPAASCSTTRESAVAWSS